MKLAENFPVISLLVIDNPFAEEGVDYSSCMRSKKGRGQFAQDYRLFRKEAGDDVADSTRRTGAYLFPYV